MMKAVRQTSRATVAPSEGEVSKNVMMEPQWSFVICRSTQIKICPRHHHSSPYRERVKKDWIDGRFSQLFWNTVKGISNRGSRMARDADKPRDRIGLYLPVLCRQAGDILLLLLGGERTGENAGGEQEERQQQHGESWCWCWLDVGVRTVSPTRCAPSFISQLQHSLPHYTGLYCVLHHWETRTSVLLPGVDNIISILIPENTSKTKVTVHILVLSVRNRWFSKQ